MSFRIALSGLNAASTHLDVTAHNIANVNTAGFKSSRALFSDVFATSSNDLSATASGAGVRTASISQQFSQGNIDFTNNNLDMAVSGEGFFVMSGREGLVYSRAGAFSVDREGNVVNGDLQKLQVFPVTAGGNFATGSLSDLKLQTTESPPKASEKGDIGVNLPANVSPPAVTPFNSDQPDSYNHATSMTVFDSLGTPHQATMYFSRTATPNQWEQRLYVDAFSTLSFNGNGILDPLTANVSYDDFDAGTGSTPISLDLNFIASTQYGNEFGVNNLYNDGYTTGRMTGIDVDAKGVVSARFTNGQLQQLGKIAVAIFNNPNGLQQLGDTSWAETYTSGGPRLGEAGTSNFGLLQAGALESSNVDLTAQLVEMITAQRNFQANAQMISTSDQVTQTIINMR
jgi:flagellar hook protein FlgE